ncbi:MAG: MipA/OmpV family protein [Kiloniellales bacterium]|nr:MipA/OmpV family protein [Kiloniellales bacterium]
MTLAAVICSALMVTPANAAEWSIGAGAGIAPDYEGSDDYEPIPLWNIKASKLYHDDTYVQIFGTKLNSNLLPHDNIRLGISGQYIFERDNVDNTQVNRMRDTDDGFLLGIMAGYDFDLSHGGIFGIEFDARYDTGGNIGGLYTGRLKYMAPFGSSWVFSAGAETTYATDDYMDEFFGVDAGNVGTSTLTAYDPDGGFKDVGLNTSLTYNFSQSWSVTGIARYTRLIGDADDSSPITDQGSENQLLGGLLVNFRF